MDFSRSEGSIGEIFCEFLEKKLVEILKMLGNLKAWLILWILTCALTSLEATGSTVTLTCLFSTKSGLDYITGDQYSCDLQSDFPYLDDVTFAVNNTHLDTKTNADVTALLIDERTIFQIPKLAGIFAELKYIKIIKAPKLKYLRKTSIAEYKEKLVHLIIQESSIEVLEAELFLGFRNLVTIDLQKNEIFYIAAGIFNGLPLKNIMFTGNDCKNVADSSIRIGNCQATDQVSCDTFIEGVAASTCKPDPISIDNFLIYQKAMSKLELDAYTANEVYETLNSEYELVKNERNSLNITYNAAKQEIKNLQSDIDILVPKIAKLEAQAEKCLDVSGTCRFINDNIIGYSCIGHNINISTSGQEVTWTGTHQPGSTVRSVFGLILRDLTVNYVPKNIGHTFSNLKSFIVQNCKLKKLSSNDFLSLNELEFIQIVLNDIASIEAGVFDELDSLKTLDLSENKIKALPAKIFAQLMSLTSINLNKNELTAVRSDFLPATNKIQSFTAKDNKFTMVESAFVWRLRSANLIDFTGNICNQKYDKSVISNYIEFYNSILKRC